MFHHLLQKEFRSLLLKQRVKTVLDTIFGQQLGREKSERIYGRKEMLVNRQCRIRVTLCEKELFAVGKNGPTLPRQRIGYPWVSLQLIPKPGEETMQRNHR